MVCDDEEIDAGRQFVQADDPAAEAVVGTGEDAGAGAVLVAVGGGREAGVVGRDGAAPGRDARGVGIDCEGAVVEGGVIPDLLVGVRVDVGVVEGMDCLGVVDEEGAVGMDDAAGGAPVSGIPKIDGADGVLDGGAVLQLEVSL